MAQLFSKGSELNSSINVFIIIDISPCSSYVAQPSPQQESGVVAVKESACVSDNQQLSSVQLSPNIKCLVFPRGDISRFKPAR